MQNFNTEIMNIYLLYYVLNTAYMYV